MNINPYLTFDGDCEAAFGFYAQCLGGTLQALLRFGETPAGAEVPADCRDKVMHACLMWGDQALMGSDCHPTQPYEPIRGCWVTLHPDSVAEAERIFAALGEGGSVQMPLQQTFWAERFGMLVDRFGVPWMINCAPAS
ncbi:VOC family protein [Pseudomonas benzenivorans]|uniref:VOC family protein n=1 Tax=Pseudomonas benzenivorans TaxID=556533 RepID=A0ABZ0PVK3_9PSED|nr:VOC family protein [Pseudomonas benzenivorans]WPC04894.1 VOC family protein [Pseudomonas benzenivorans]